MLSLRGTHETRLNRPIKIVTFVRLPLYSVLVFFFLSLVWANKNRFLSCMSCPLSKLFQRFGERLEWFFFSVDNFVVMDSKLAFCPMSCSKWHSCKNQKLCEITNVQMARGFANVVRFSCVYVCDVFFFRVCFTRTALVNISLIRFYFVFAMRQYHWYFKLKMCSRDFLSNVVNFFRPHLPRILWFRYFFLLFHSFEKLKIIK